MDRKLITQVTTVTATGQIQSGWNSVLLINMGTVLATVNTMPLVPNVTPGQPGAGLRISHNANEVDDSQLYIDFPNGNTGGKVYVVANYYE